MFLIDVDREKGNRLTLKEIQTIVQKELNNGVHDNAEKDNELLAVLKESRELKATGSRSSNRAAAMDYNAALRRIQDEVRQVFLMRSSLKG